MIERVTRRKESKTAENQESEAIRKLIFFFNVICQEDKVQVINCGGTV